MKVLKTLLATLFLACFCSSAFAASEIQVSGKGFTILDGDTSPNTTDNTDFGIVAANSGMVRKVFVIANLGNADLAISDVSVDSPQFSVSILPQSSVPVDGVTSFEILFQPSAAGVHNATISITNDDGDENPYNFVIRGTARVPDIQVQGTASLNINAGDTSPNVEDGTDFGTLTVQQSASHTFRILNTGDIDLSIASVGISSGPFSITSQPDTLVGAGGSTTMTLRYLPTATGSHNATVSIISNDMDETPYTFNIRGNANAPELDMYGNGVIVVNGDTSPSLDDDTRFPTSTFGAVTPATTSFTFRNTGSGVLIFNTIALSDNTNFRIVQMPAATINPGQNSTITIEYDPVSPGTHTTVLNVTNNDLDEGTFSITLDGTTIVPHANFGALNNGDTSPSVGEGTDFGSAILGAPATVKNYPIRNDGPGVMVLESVDITPGSQFSIVPGTVFPITIPVGTSYNLPVQFEPTTTGLHQATVTIQNNDPTKDPFTFMVQGTGNTRRAVVGSTTNPITDGDMTPSLDDGTNLGTANMGDTPKTTTIPIKNDGTVALTIDNVLLSNPTDFYFVTDPAGTIAPGATKNLVIGFNPQSGGLKTSTVTINSNDPTSPFEFAVQGYSRPVVGFDDTLIGAAPVTKNQVFTNDTAAAITISSVNVTPSGTFAYVGPAVPITVNPGSSVNIPVRYTPTTTGDHTASVTVRTVGDNPSYPYTFIVNGHADQRLVEVGEGVSKITAGDTTPSVVDSSEFGPVIIGTGAQVTHSWPVKNNGNVPLTISSISMSNTTDFTVITNPTGTISPGGSATLSIKFLPQSVNYLTSVVTINSNDPRTPFAFTIGGEGRPRVDAPEGDISILLTDRPWEGSFAGPFVGFIGTLDENGNVSIPIAGGFDSFNVRPDGTFTAKGTFNDMPITLKGKLNPDGSYYGTYKLPDGSMAEISLQTKTGSDGSIHLFGTLLHNGTTWYVDVVRSGGVSLPLNMIGKHTMVIPSEEDFGVGTMGDGIGYGKLRIDGKFFIKMELGDTKKVTFRGQVTPRYQMVVLRRLYNYNSGMLGLRVNFRDVANISDFDGDVFWKKRPNARDNYYASGFNLKRKIVGNKYTTPAINKPAIPALLSNNSGNTVLSLGSLSTGVTVSPKLMQWSNSNVITYGGPEKVTMKINKSNGLLKGIFKDYASRSVVYIHAVVLQKQNRAAGMSSRKNYNYVNYMSILPRQYTGY